MNKMISNRFWIYVLISFGSLVGCVKSTEVGSELIENEANVTYIDTFPVRITTVRTDSVKTYDTINTSSIYPLGFLKDSIVGTVKSSIYTQFILDTLKPNFDAIPSLDSIVLFLAIDSSKVYGANTDEQTFEIYKLTESLPSKTNLYSNRKFSTDATPLTSYSFYPNLSKRPFEGDSSTYVAYQRIPLPLSFGNDLLQIMKDTNKTNSYSTFLTFFKGLKIQPSKATNTMLSLDISKAQSGAYSSNTVTNITMYYHGSDGKVIQSKLRVGTLLNNYGTTYMEYNHDYNDGIKSFIDNPQLSDSLFVVEGLAGVSTKLELPDISSLGNTLLINKAELELTASTYRPSLNNISRIFVTRKNADGSFSLIRDVIEGSSIYGGSVETYYEGDGKFLQKYKINLAAHYQDALKSGSGVSFEIYLIPENKAYSPLRTVFYGKNNKTYAPKLRLTYTKVN